MNLGEIAAKLGEKLGNMDPAQTTEFVSRVAERVQPGSGDFVRQTLNDPKNAPQPTPEKKGPEQEEEEDLNLVQLLTELLRQLFGLQQEKGAKAEADHSLSASPLAVLAAAKEVHAEMKAETKLDKKAELEAAAAVEPEPSAPEAGQKKEVKKELEADLDADADLTDGEELGDDMDLTDEEELGDEMDLTDDEELGDGMDLLDVDEPEAELGDEADLTDDEELTDGLDHTEEDEEDVDLVADKGQAEKEDEVRNEGVAIASTRGTENEVKGVRVVGDGFAQASASMDQRSVQYDEKYGQQVGGSQALAGTSSDSVPMDELVTEQRGRCKLTERATERHGISVAEMDAAADARAEATAEFTAEEEHAASVSRRPG